MNRLLSILICLGIQIPFLVLSLAQNAGPIVTISQGTLQGGVSMSRDGRPFYTFANIPYGIIRQRYGSPLPAIPGWIGIRNATEYGPGCARYGFDENFQQIAIGIEDCLDINVHTPYLPGDVGSPVGPLPVLVWIHGGGFIEGLASAFKPDYFMDEDIILVTLNYRLGELGYLDAGIEEARGNQAMRDKVLALKWVKANIDKFNGNASRVTIFGESAAANAVTLLILSPMSQGLFSAAIAHSGGASCPHVSKIPGKPQPRDLAISLDCPTTNPLNMVRCLQGKTVDELIAVNPQPLSYVDQVKSFGPTIETFRNGPNDPEVFLDKDPFLLLQSGNFTPVPLIIGQVAFEYLQAVEMFKNESGLARFNRQFGRILPDVMYYQHTAEDPCLITSKIREFFFQGAEELTMDMIPQIQNLFTDRILTQCKRKMAGEFAKFMPTYVFNFTEPEVLLGDEPTPPSHSTELFYLFKFGWPFDFIPEIKPGGKGYEFSKKYVKFFAQFVQNGVPGPLFGSAGGTWRPLVAGQKQEWLQVEAEPFMKPADEVFESRFNFWESLPLNEYDKTIPA